MFAINIYIWPLPVHDTLLHHIDLYFIWCNQCPLHTAHNSLANAEVWRWIFICRVRLNIHIIVIQLGWIYRTVNTPSHNLCGSCDLASNLNDVTGDELDIDVSIALFRNQTILCWYRCLCGYSSYAPILIWWLFLQLSPSPSINCTFQQEDTTVVKKFQHILGVCSSSKQSSWKIDITSVISAWNWNFSLVRNRYFVKLLVITLTYILIKFVNCILVTFYMQLMFCVVPDQT